MTTAPTTSTPQPAHLRQRPRWGSVANRQTAQRRLSTTPFPVTRTPAPTPSSAPSASTRAAAAPDSAASDSASAVTPGSAVVVAALLVLAAMVAAGFRARARLGRLG
jgi:hypothetical protein